MSNAFASILQARPSPTFGRPVHRWGSPLDYGPVLLLMPFGFHLAMDTLPSGVQLSGGFRSVLACFRLSPLCPFRLLHTCHSPRPARYYPRFWIQRSSSERRRDSNPPEQRAAQRKVIPGRFHGHMGYPTRPQPVRQRQQVPRHRPKLPLLFSLLSFSFRPQHTSRHALLVYVQPTAARMQYFHIPPPLAAKRRTLVSRRNSFPCSPPRGGGDISLCLSASRSYSYSGSSAPE